MVRLARPGGYVALQDLDAISFACEPPHPAWDRLLTTWVAAERSAGLDPFIGRRLPGFLRAAGLVDVEVAAHAHVQPSGFAETLLHLTDILREDLVAAGRFAAAEFDDVVRQLAIHLEHPDTLVLHSTLFQAWGRKPLTASA
jgi:hypothetical protein